MDGVYTYARYGTRATNNSILQLRQTRLWMQLCTEPPSSEGAWRSPRPSSCKSTTRHHGRNLVQVLHDPKGVCARKYEQDAIQPCRFSPPGDIIGAEGGEADYRRSRPVELPRLARPKGCYAAYDNRSIDELSGRTTSRPGYIGPTLLR